MERIIVNNATLRFKVYYDKSYTIKGKVARMVKYIIFNKKPEYHTALSNINITIKEGDIVGLVGPNGSGKTTLLRVISGIYHPDEGNVTRKGKISTLLTLGTGFDNKLNGIDNIRLNGLTIGMSTKEIDEKIQQIMDFAELGKHIYKPMKYYSSGMISRLSFAIVLSMQPDILLIDEILSVGDLAFVKKSEKAMHELLSKSSCQVIATHNMSLVREHCNRAIYIKNGYIRVDGTPEEAIGIYTKESGVTSSH
jgi:ABC-type polysaccharide/polyol phosphate transport system ATPase subunit